MNQKIICIVLDGWGIAKAGKGNCISQAKTPNFDEFIKNFPHSKLNASGEAVGLPKGSQGNSEVGHLHMGAGRIVWQPYELINRLIKNKKFFKNKSFLDAIENCKKNNSNLHLMGLCSDEGVHATTKHLLALLELAKEKKFKRVVVHCFLDGRDVPEKSAVKYIKQIESALKKTKTGKIGSIIGRYYAMDRDKNWNRTKESYDLLTLGKGFEAKNAIEGIKQAYSRGDKTDYYVQPTIIKTKNEKPAIINDKDSIIFFNFRTDRPKQLSLAFTSKKFNYFKRKKQVKTFFVTFTDYKNGINANVAFEKTEVKNTLGEILSKNNYTQLRLAETEKTAHVTYFFNSQKEKKSKGEYHITVPSSKVKSYDLKPEMSAKEISEVAIKEINTKEPGFIFMNFANLDLVGHAAVISAEIKACEVVDTYMKKVVDAGLKKNYTIILTADHGSGEEKLYPNGEAKPSHSCNPVNFILVSNEEKLKNIKLKNGGLIDIAPTILDLLKIRKPKEMTGISLIKH